MKHTCRPELSFRWRWVIAPVVAGLLVVGCSSENPTSPRAIVNAEFQTRIEESLAALVQELHWQIEAPQRLPARIEAGESTPFDGSYAIRIDHIRNRRSESRYSVNGGTGQVTRVIENSSNGSLMLDSSQPSALRFSGGWRISGLESHSRSTRRVRLTV